MMHTRRTPLVPASASTLAAVLVGHLVATGCLLAAEQRPAVELQTYVTPVVKRVAGVFSKSIRFSPDGQHAAYVFGTQNTSRMIVNTVQLLRVPPKGKTGDPETCLYIKTTKGEVYDGFRVPGAIFSPNSERVGYVATKGDKSIAVVDGVERGTYDAIFDLHFSPDSKRFAFIGRYKKAEGWEEVAVVDGVESRRWRGVGVNTPLFSPDSKRAVYVGIRQDGKHVVVLDGKCSEPCKGVLGKSLAWSPDSKRLVCSVDLPDRFAVLVNGVRLEQGYGWLPNIPPSFSPDGTRMAYVALRKVKAFVVVDGKECKGYDDLGGLTLSPDGRHVGYNARRGDKYLVVVDEQEGKEYDVIVDGTPAFSPDGSKWIYFAKEGEKWLAVTQGIPSPKYDAVGANFLVFSPDGQRIAYACERDKRRFFVLDGVESKGYDTLSYGVFSPDSKRFAYPAWLNGKSFIVVEGKESRAHDEVWPAQFSPDGKHLAYRAQRAGKMLVVLDGQEGREYDEIGDLRFCPDSRHLAYEAKREGMWRIVVDGMESQHTFDHFLKGRLRFHTPQVLHHLAVKDTYHHVLAIEILRR